MNLHTRLQGYCSSTPPHPSTHRMPGSARLGPAASTATACAPGPGTRLLSDTEEGLDLARPNPNLAPGFRIRGRNCTSTEDTVARTDEHSAKRT
jgi:hypothetical protein